MALSVPQYGPKPTGKRKTIALGVIIGVHVVVIYLIQSGLGRLMIEQALGPMETRLIEEMVVEKEAPPPPPPKFQAPPPVFVAMPEIAITETPTQATITATAEKPKTAPPPPKADVIIPPRQNPRRPNRGTEEIYPAMSRRLGEEGTVVLLLTVNEEGRVTDAAVTETSGFSRLDEAAQKEAVRSWRFLPGTINGKPSAMQMPLRVVFKLPE